MRRWRGRRLAGLAVVLVLAASAGAAIGGNDGAVRRWVVVRDDAGTELARAPLPGDGQLTLRYRNSLYGSLAEEHFVADGAGLRLVALAADEPAVLEEYYGAFDAVLAGPEGARRWRVDVVRPPIELPLRVQATALGERTLIVDGREIALWRLVGGSASTVVVLTLEERR